MTRKYFAFCAKSYNGLVMDYNQYVLVGSTVRSYLSWLHDRGEAAAEIADNRLVWCSVNGGTRDGGAI